MSKEYVKFDPLIVKLGGMNLILPPRQNKYLGGMNENLFKPHGLYAMLMTWKPARDSSPQTLVSTVDMNNKIVKSVAAREISGRSSLRSTSGKTIGQSQMPESAELVFPLLETASDEQKMNAMKKAGGWLGEWRDKRSTAKFVCARFQLTQISMYTEHM